MKIAEQVTFGGSGLEREGLLRDKPEEIAKLLANPDARALLLWRGKPLLQGDQREVAGLIPLDHKVLRDAKEPIFLGQDEGGPRFAFDISRCEPQEMPETRPSDHPVVGDVSIPQDRAHLAAVRRAVRASDDEFRTCRHSAGQSGTFSMA